jgi:hypothetical protein
MSNDGKLAGPIEFDQAVFERDAMIREDNDGDRIDDSATESAIKFFEGDGWKVYRGGYLHFRPKRSADDPPQDHIIAERKDYDVVLIDLTELIHALGLR